MADIGELAQIAILGDPVDPEKKPDGAGVVGAFIETQKQFDLFSIELANLPASIEADMVDLVEQAEAARDAAVVNSPTYPDEPTGRAAVADGVYFLVQGSADVAAYEYRRVNAGGSVLITTFPSKSYVDKLRKDVLPSAKTNLLNNADISWWTSGYKISVSGILQADALYCVSPLVPTAPNTIYSRGLGGTNLAFFDADGVAIPLAGHSTRIFKTPSNARFVQIGVVISTLANVGLYRTPKTPLPKPYVPGIEIRDFIPAKQALIDSLFDSDLGTLDINLKVDVASLPALLNESDNLFKWRTVTPGMNLAFNQVTAVGTTSTSDYIAVTPSTTYTRTVASAWEEYDAEGIWLASHASGGSTTITTGASTYLVRFAVLNVSGQYFQFFRGTTIPIIPETGSRFYLDPAIVSTGNLARKKIAWVGDSNTEGHSHFGYYNWVPNRVQKRHGGMHYNIGIGGTVAGQNKFSSVYSELCGFKLFPAFVSGDYTAIRTAAETIFDPDAGAYDYNGAIVDQMERIVWDDVNAAVVNYGNDWGNDRPLGSWATAPDSTGATFYGAMKYMIETFAPVYPACPILLQTPVFRGAGLTPNAVGLTVPHYVDAILDIASRYPLAKPLDLYYESGINSMNMRTFLNDVDITHYSDAGVDLVARLTGEWLSAHVA